MHMTIRSAVRLLGVTGLGIAAACSDGTSPKPDRFNASRVEAGVAVVQRVSASPMLGSLQVVARFAGGMTSTAAASVAGRWDSGLENTVRRLAASTADVGAALIPVIRPSVLGTTFGYDASKRTYVPAPSRAGAPANGVRFILYETAANGDPIPGKEIGYADLTDERQASPSTAGVRLVVVSGGVTFLNYSFDLTGSLQAATADVHGYVSDGTERLDFSIKTGQQLFGRGGRATLDATLTVAQHDFEVTAHAEGTAGDPDSDGKINLTIKSSSDVIVVDAETVEGQLDALVTVNGQTLATATGDPHAPTIRAENGRELTEAEMHALAAIVTMSGEIFALVTSLLQPAGVLLLIALGV